MFKDKRRKEEKTGTPARGPFLSCVCELERGCGVREGVGRRREKERERERERGGGC